MEKDDEEVVDVSMSVVKYSIMPSLVALQTMRNRLHLALLGKKLMKWTALATGKELRRLSLEMATLLGDFGQRCRDAFIHLARCRYQMPSLNVIVKECCPAKARATVEVTSRSVAGVKVINLGVQETGPDEYSFLGLGRSGELIQETKRVWYELLKLMVARCSFRLKFRMIDEANKAATKKKNVLQRLIIPKINITSKYVLGELDEMEREETFRLKRFKELRYKSVKVLKKVRSEEEIVKKVEQVVVLVEPRREPEPEPEPEPEQEPEPEVSTPPHTPPRPAEELIIEHMNEVLRLAEIIQNAALIQQSFGLTRCDLGKLKVQLHESLKLSQTSKKTRECVKCPASQCHCPASLNLAIPPSVSLPLQRPKPPCYEAALKLMPTTKVATPMPDYIFSKLNSQIPDPRIEVNEHLNDLQNHVDKVICLTHCYSQDGVLSKSVEDFLKCCHDVSTKINEIKERKTVSAKIARLKREIEHLERITTLSTDGLACDSIKSLMSRCKDFKTKLECRSASKGASSVCSIEHFLEQINVSIELGKKAKMEGLVSDSVEEFISTCKELKAKIDTQEEKASKPKVIIDLLGNLNDIMKCISQYKQNGLLSDSMEKFYTTCKSTKVKLDNYRPPPGVKLDASQMTNIKRECGCKIPKKYEICPSCQELGDNLQISSTKFIARTCEKSFSSKEESEDDSCKCAPLQESVSDPADTPCKKSFSSTEESVDDSCKCAPLQESAPEAAPEAASTTYKKSVSPKGESEDDYHKCAPLQESAQDPAGTPWKKSFSSKESVDDSCKCAPLQESATEAASTTYKKSDSPKGESEDDYYKCAPLQESAQDPAGTPWKKSFSSKEESVDDSCKCVPLQESAPDPEGTPCKKSFSSKEESVDDSCKFAPLQEAAPGAASTTYKKSVSPKGESEDDYYKCAPLQESATDLAGTPCKKNVSSRGESEDDTCKYTPLQESAPDAANTPCRKSFSSTEESEDNSCKCATLQVSAQDPAGTTYKKSVSPKGESEDDYCKCTPLQESAPDPADTCSCDTEKGYEDCHVISDRIGPEISAFITKTKGSKTSLGGEHSGTCIGGPHPIIYTAVIQILKSDSRLFKSSSSQSYVPELNIPKFNQITAQQPSKTCMQIKIQTCESFQTIPLDKTKCKECDGNSFQTIPLDKTKCKECGGNSFETIALYKTKCKECDDNSFQTIALDKTKCKECDGNSFQTIALDKTKCKECDGNSFKTIALDKTKYKECDCNSFQTISLDKTKCKECDGNSFQTIALDKTKFEFDDISAISVKDSNSVPRMPGSSESVKSTKKVCNAPTTKGFIKIVRNVKSEILIRTLDLLEPILSDLWSHTSVETLITQDRNNDSDSAQLDPFF